MYASEVLNCQNHTKLSRNRQLCSTSLIPDGDQIVSKTYMTRVEGENTLIGALSSPTTALEDFVLFQISGNI